MVHKHKAHTDAFCEMVTSFEETNRAEAARVAPSSSSSDDEPAKHKKKFKPKKMAGALVRKTSQGAAKIKKWLVQ